MSRLPFEDEPATPRAEPHEARPSPAAARTPIQPRERRPDPPPPAARPSRQVLTVSELSAAIRGTLESEFVDVWVEGEISNGRVWNTGHFYFTLKDAGAQIKAVTFRSALRLLKFKPQDGLHVIARGRVSLYEPKGEYQLVCEHMEPRGYGPLQLAFEQLKKRLAAEGLFDEARKRPLPSLPRRIGIVTSIDGAALRDIVRVLRRRYPNLHLVIAPSRVQGDGAAREVARALRFVSRIDAVDVVIVGRGGGSLEDLWVFNEEVVARAIVACPVPVISAVGHETDFTIADFVADLRAPTPSAAAELVVRRKDEFWAHIDRLGQRLHDVAIGRLRRLDSRLHALVGRPGLAQFPTRLAWKARETSDLTSALGTAIQARLSRAVRQVDGLNRQLERVNPRQRLADVRLHLAAREQRSKAAMTSRMHRAQSGFRATAARLESLSPLAVLGRGYAVCWDETRTRIVRDAATVAAGDTIRVTLDRGEIEAEVRAPSVDAGS